MINKIINFIASNLQPIVILALIFVPLFIVVGLILLNWKSSENYELLKPVVGGLLVSCFIILTTFFSPIEPIKYKTDIMVLTKGDTVLALPLISKGFPEPLNGYDKISTLIFEFNKNKVEIAPKKEHQYLLELIEYASMQWIGDNYPLHWQLDRSWIRGISGGGGGIKIKSDAETSPKQIMLADLLNGNMYSASSGGSAQSIYLPKGTRTTYKDHVLMIDNNNVQIKIYFGKTQFMEKLGVGLGKGLEKDYGPDLYAHYFTVEWVINTKRPRRWSLQTKEQVEWAKEIGDAYQKAFSFSILEEALSKRYSMVTA